MFESIDPFTGRPWAVVPRAAPPTSTPRSGRARRVRQFETVGPHDGHGARAAAAPPADVIAEHADRIALVESTDNGKLIREMGAQLKGLADYYEYFAGWADKIGGETIPADRSDFLIYTLREPVGVVARDHAVELAGAAGELEDRARAGGRLHDRGQARRAGAGLDARVRARWSSEAGFPPGVVNVRHRLRGRRRRAARRAPGRRQGRLHGRDVDRHAPSCRAPRGTSRA